MWCWRRLLKVLWISRRSNQSILKQIIRGVHWKDWCWSWNSNTLATWCEELTHLKRPWCWDRFRQEEKGMTEDEMAGWHHQLSGHGFGWTLAVGDGQGVLVCCNSWGQKESDTTERLNWTEMNTYIWNLEKWHWSIYLQGNNGETIIENRLMDRERGGDGEMDGTSNMKSYITICKIDSQREFAV